ncbi:MAG: ABC transporter ATP-binding protein [Firmicutes bacterium]|jgi:branched-chain amino acid transport system ATP-binding protein|nr:ABC transporter ATP-binding protein [Bacillota bacterium]
MLELVDVCARYNGTEVLSGVSLSVEPGKITAIIGANGAGKTTTLRCIIGILRPSKGKILWRDRDLTALDTKDIVKSGITMVPEGRHVFPHMTVSENLDMGAYLRRNIHEIKKDRSWVFELFPVLKIRSGQTAGTLSGGEQQMLAVGRALMSAPDILLMDEPSMGLAPMLVDEVFHVIHQIKQTGKTVLLVEQNAVKALSIADKGYVLELGLTILSGTGTELMNNPEVERAYLGI